MLTAYYGGKKLFIECFPTDKDAICFPNSNRAVKEIQWPENYPPSSQSVDDCLLKAIDDEMSKLNEQDAHGFVWWNRFKEFVIAQKIII